MSQKNPADHQVLDIELKHMPMADLHSPFPSVFFIFLHEEAWVLRSLDALHLDQW